MYVVSTPIGNRDDMSLRAMRALREASLIAAEDTRVARRLLTMLNLRAGGRIVSVRQHNENAAAQKLLATLADGESAVYICDAGTPAVSDPGARLVAAARAAGVVVSPIAGASALTAIIAAAGIADNAPVHFYGFAPTAKRQRQNFFHQLARLDGCCALFESPRRIGQTLSELAQIWGGDCRAVVGREISKRNEQIVADTLAGLARAVAEGGILPRGEFVLLAETPGIGGGTISPQQLFAELSAELPPRRAAAITARLTDADAKALYQNHINRGKEGK